MVERFNPLDPLGIFEPIKRDFDTLVEGLRLPPLPGSSSAAPPRLPNPLEKLPDPLGLFRRRKA